jgi:hypothetical protein
VLFEVATFRVGIERDDREFDAILLVDGDDLRFELGADGKHLVQVGAARNTELRRRNEATNAALAARRELHENAVAFDESDRPAHVRPDDEGASRDARRRGHRLGIGLLGRGGAHVNGHEPDGARPAARLDDARGDARSHLHRQLAPLVRQILGLDEPLLLAVELDEHGIAPELHHDDVELLADAERSSFRRATGVALEERGERFPFGLVGHRCFLA